MTAPQALPLPDSTSEPYWSAARDGRLLIQLCGACGRHFAYARPFCPTCWSDDVSWVAASGAGRLYTWSVVYVNDLPAFRGMVPYVAAVVDLAEGPRLSTLVVDCPVDDLRIGMPLSVTFLPRDEAISLPVFQPAGAGGS